MTPERKECAHVWTEGGWRDRGRYHCSRCFVCLNPMDLVRENADLRARLSSIPTVPAGHVVVVVPGEVVEARVPSVHEYGCENDCLKCRRLREIGAAVLAARQKGGG